MRHFRVGAPHTKQTRQYKVLLDNCIHIQQLLVVHEKMITGNLQVASDHLQHF